MEPGVAIMSIASVDESQALKDKSKYIDQRRVVERGSKRESIRCALSPARRHRLFYEECLT